MNQLVLRSVGVLLVTKPLPGKPLPPIAADEAVDFPSELEIQRNSHGETDDAVMKLGSAIRKTGTGLSVSSNISQLVHLHRRPMNPKMRRSQTALSSLSQKTGGTEQSMVPLESGLNIGPLRGKSTVSFYADWPVTDEYEFEDHLGEGGFGQVFMGKQKMTGVYFAIKRIPAVSVKDIQRYEREIKVFERLSSSYVVRLYEIFRDDLYLYLVMDLCTGGDLMNYLMNYWTDPAHPERNTVVTMYPQMHHVLPEKEVGVIIWAMLAGIAYLHHHRFLHRDVKLENYMLTKKEVNPQLQLCDFGLSIRVEKGNQITGTVGTLLYMSPEVLIGKYDHKCDIWSVGVSAYIVATMCSPWGASSDETDIRWRITNNRREIWPKVDRPSEMTKLVDKMMTHSDDDRPSAKDLYAESRWLRKHNPHPEPKGACAGACTVA